MRYRCTNPNCRKDIEKFFLICKKCNYPYCGKLCQDTDKSDHQKSCHKTDIETDDLQIQKCNELLSARFETLSQIYAIGMINLAGEAATKIPAGFLLLEFSKNILDITLDDFPQAKAKAFLATEFDDVLAKIRQREADTRSFREIIAKSENLNALPIVINTTTYCGFYGIEMKRKN